MKRLARKLCGRRRLQPLFERLHTYALAGMNAGNGGALESSGELLVLDRMAAGWRQHPSVVFDVGANVGGYARAVLDRGASTTKLYCFEPSQGAFTALQASVGADTRVTCINVGLSDKDETRTLFSDGPTSGLASVYARELAEFGVVLAGVEDVRLTSVDSFCHDARIARIDFLKLDVEGHELPVLRGASDMLARRAIGAIQFEFGGCNIDSRTYFKDFVALLQPRYDLFRVVIDGLTPVPTYRLTDEIFITTNYVALLREADG